jgi:hypothetical protein
MRLVIFHDREGAPRFFYEKRTWAAQVATGSRASMPGLRSKLSLLILLHFIISDRALHLRPVIYTQCAIRAFAKWAYADGNDDMISSLLN